VPRCFRHNICTPLATMMAFLLLSNAAIASEGQVAAGQSLTGRLAFVEPALERITIVPDGEVHLFDLLVEDGSEVRQGDRVLTLSDLVIEVGRRVTVRYRVDGDRRIAESIIVDPPG
jgi:hypothetical protein